MLNSAKIELGPLRRRPAPLGPQEVLVGPHESGVRREVKQVRALAVALAQLGLTPLLSKHLPRAAAGPEVLVRDDAVCSPWPR